MSVLDPYRPDNYEAEISRLTRAQNNHGDLGEVMGLIVGLTVLGAALALLVGGVSWFWVESNWLLARNVVGAIYGAAIAGVVGVLTHQAAQRRELRRLEALSPAVSHPMCATEQLKRLANSLRRLPRERRSELRPLWDAALEAAEILRVDPANAAAMGRLTKRADAAASVLKAELDLAEAQRRDEEAAVLKGVVSRYGSTDDSDLELANMYAEALRAGVTRYNQLSS